MQQGVAFVGLGMPAKGYWCSWRVGGEMTGDREFGARGTVAEARRLALSHTIPTRCRLRAEWDGADPHDLQPIAILGANLCYMAVQGSRKDLVRTIHGLRLLLKRNWFWIEAEHPRPDLYWITAHALPDGNDAAERAFSMIRSGSRQSLAAE